MREKAVILLSGGLDSCTCMAVAQEAGCELYPVSFVYGQRYDREVDCAKRIAAHFHAAEHLIIETNMDAIGGSAVTDRSISTSASTPSTIPAIRTAARNLSGNFKRWRTWRPPRRPSAESVS